MAFIKARDLKHSFKRHDDDGNVIGEIPALDGVDLDVEAGQFVAVLGPNGSGKSTFAKHLNVLLLPGEGALWVDGKDASKEENTFPIRQAAGMIFQNPDNQIVAGVVEEDVAFGPENMGVPTEEIWKRVADSLEAVGMTAYRYHSPNRLSGGQKQRVAIAGVVAMRPKCIIMDESTAMLDPNGRREVLKTVHALNREEGVTVILITHYMEEAADADRIFVLDEGKLAMQGTPREVFSDVEGLRRCGLDVPQMTRLAHELREEGLLLPKGILNRKELLAALSAGLHVPTGSASLKGGVSERKLASKEAAKPEGAEGEAAESFQRNGATPEVAEFPLKEAAGKVKWASERNGAAEKMSELRPKKNASKTVGTTVAALQGTTRETDRRVKLELRDICYTYSPGTAYERKALTQINLKLYEGDFLGLIGHTGSGKSTLMQLLDGLLRPTSGSIFYEGQDISGAGFSMRSLRSSVGLVFQYPEYQLFETTVEKDVAFGPKNKGLDAESAAAKAREALRLVGLGEDTWGMSPFELSGGQKRRAAIAGVIAMEPSVLVLDEPTAGLDPRGRDELFALICRLHEEQHMTILLVSHSMEDVAQYVSRLVVLQNGEVRMDGTPLEVFARVEELEEVSLAAPQVTYLMEDLRRVGYPVASAVTTVEEAKREILALVRSSGGALPLA